MNKEFGGFNFRLICKIKPKKDSAGNFVEFFPHLRYENNGTKKLHKYGKGPFCKFTIPTIKKEGVYLLVIDEKPRYVGECEDFSNRWNTGYGNISLRACFEGGQSTNCRINNLILNAKKADSDVELYFLEIIDRFAIEVDLIQCIKPNWNKTIGKPSLSKSTKIKKIIPKSAHKSNSRGSKKYLPLTMYLKKIQNDKTMSFDEIQEILGYKLPPSASKHKAWWSNGGHPHANAWLEANCKVSKVKLGEKITFRKF